MGDSKKETKHIWNEIISKKLKEGVTLSDLDFTYDSGISLAPNITADDIEGYNHVISDIKPWINMASITANSAAELNELAHLALTQGANGLDLQISTDWDVKEVLEGIMTKYLKVRLDCKGWKAENINKAKRDFDASNFPNVRWVESNHQYHISSQNRVEEIKNLLQTINKSFPCDIMFSVSKNLLFEIASLRALRSILNEEGLKNFRIHGRFDVEGTNELGDYNLIEKTYKVLSIVLGGADTVLTDYTGDEDSRLTLNIQNVLDLESGFKNVMDPVGGAFYIEKLTGEIIEKVKD